MLQQERDDRLLVGVVGGIQAELLETFVLADQIGHGTVEDVDDFLEPLARWMIFQIFDDVELDIARAKYLERAFRVTSARIVKNRYPFHWHLFFSSDKLVSGTSPDLFRRVTGEGSESTGFDGSAVSGYNSAARN